QHRGDGVHLPGDGQSRPSGSTRCPVPIGSYANPTASKVEQLSVRQFAMYRRRRDAGDNRRRAGDAALKLQDNSALSADQRTLSVRERTDRAVVEFFEVWTPARRQITIGIVR